jgi:hypothetical protein
LPGYIKAKKESGKMRSILILLMAVAFIALPTAFGYDATQQAMINGTTLSWKMATAYAAQDIPTFNALADQWNAWVRQYFGEDANLLMQKMTGPIDLTKPYILANNSNISGIVHKIDGMNEMNGPTYTTNDLNMLPDSAIAAYRNSSSNVGDGYLGGI